MAIAFDAASTNSGSGVTSVTVSHTCSGANRCLFVAVTADNADNLTGVTYGGVSMTLVDKHYVNGWRWAYLYYLSAPAAGTANIVATNSGASYIEVNAASYTGVSQSGQPEASAKSSGSASTKTTTVTTLTDNAWVIQGAAIGAGGATAGSGTTQRNTTLVGAIQDSGGPVTPAGLKSLIVNQASASDIGGIVAAIAPVGLVPPVITAQPTDQTANEPGTATFSVTATGATSYQWKRANPGSGTFTNVSGATSSSYTTGATGCAADHNAQYKVDCTNADGTTTSNAATLTVRSTLTTSRPDTDVTVTGWTPTGAASVAGTINESVASDTEYSTSPTLSGSTAPATIALKYPVNTGTWTASIRAKTSTGTATLRVYLLNDSNTVMGTSADQTITSTYGTYTLSITTTGPATRARIEIVTP